MKKMLSALMMALLAASANAKINQEKFEEDTSYYNSHKDDAKSIIVLLSQFNTDRDGIREAFEGYVAGDLSKWQKLVDKLKSAKKYEDKLQALSYFQSCRSSSIYADLMWSSGSSMRNNSSEWNNPNSFYVKQFNDAKKTFQNEFAECKQKVNNPPKKADYEENIERVGSWELNK